MLAARVLDPIAFSAGPAQHRHFPMSPRSELCNFLPKADFVSLLCNHSGVSKGSAKSSDVALSRAHASGTLNALHMEQYSVATRVPSFQFLDNGIAPVAPFSNDHKSCLTSPRTLNLEPLVPCLHSSPLLASSCSVSTCAFLQSMFAC